MLDTHNLRSLKRLMVSRDSVPGLLAPRREHHGEKTQWSSSALLMVPGSKAEDGAREEGAKDQT